MNAKQIVFTEINKAMLLDISIPDTLAPRDVLVKTAITTISTGTERANITGDPNISINGAAGVSFPRTAGYSGSGTVVAVGSEVKSVSVGDRVAIIWGKHKSYNLLNEDSVVRLDEDIDLETAAIAFISTFPMAAVRKTRVEMGESALVMGVGILGLIAIKLLRAAGAAPIIAADPNPKRREIALKSGADYAFDPLSDDFAGRVKAVSDGGANVSIEVSGVGAGFNGALDCMARFGRIALLGCTRSSDFTVDYYKKIHGPGITVIGAHTLARPEYESHSGYFTHRDDVKALLRLCKGGRLTLSDIITETHSPLDCEKVFERLIYDRDFPIGVQFDWRKI